MPAAFGPQSTIHARFQEWVRTGAFARAWTLLLEEYDELVGLDLHVPVHLIFHRVTLHSLLMPLGLRL